MKFTEFDLDPAVLSGIEAAGFEDCTPVQAETLAESLNGRDVTVQSQTGTGKTAAFLITIFNRMARQSPDAPPEKALVVAPTRELAVQIEADARILATGMPVRMGTIFGGVPYARQEQLLKEGYDLLIATPGRLLDFHKQRKIDMKLLTMIVIDEADRLFDMGFYPDLLDIMRAAPEPSKRLTMLFSATLSTKVRNLAWRHMNDPAEVEIEPEHMTVDTVTQWLHHVAKDEKMNVLLGVLRTQEAHNGIVFCNTKRTVEIVAKRLAKNGIRTEFIIGDLPQKRRLRIIEQVKSGEIPFLVATDVAARGLHIDGLDIVINYDLPEDPEAYVHRIGRTARAGKSGVAVSLACERYVYGLDAIEDLIGRKIDVRPVTNELIVADESAGEHIQLDQDHRREHGARPQGRSPGDRGRGRATHGRKPSAHDRPALPRPVAREEGDRATRSRGEGSEARPTRAVAGSATGRTRDESAASRPSRSGGSGGESSRSPRKQSMEDRLAYYRKKYGEDFVLADSQGTEKPKAKSASNRQPQGSDSAGGRERPKSASPPGQSTSGQSTPAATQNASQRGATKTTADKPSEAPAAPPGRRPGLLARLFGRKRKD